MSGPDRRYSSPDNPAAAAGEGPDHTGAVDNPEALSEIDQLVWQPNHRRRLDCVFVGSRHAHPSVQCRIHSARIAFDQPVDGIWASDHFDVIAELDVDSGESS